MTGLIKPSRPEPPSEEARRPPAHWRLAIGGVIAAVALTALGALPAWASSPIPPEPTVTSASLAGATVNLAGTIQALADSCGADDGPHVGCGAYFELQGPQGTIVGHTLFWTDFDGPFAVTDDIYLPNVNAPIGTYTPVLVAFNKSGQSFTSPPGPPVVVGAELGHRQARITVAGLPGRCASRAFDLRVAITDSAAIKHARMYLAGRTLIVTARARFRVVITVRSLTPGRHDITVVVHDSADHRVLRTVDFSKCRRPSKGSR